MTAAARSEGLACVDAGVLPTPALAMAAMADGAGLTGRGDVWASGMLTAANISALEDRSFQPRSEAVFLP